MMFAMFMVPLVATAGAAIDYSRAYQQRTVLQDALDAGALAANRLVGLVSDEQIYAEAMAFINANTNGRLDFDPIVQMTIEGGSVTLRTPLNVSTNFLGIIGVETINFDLRSVSVAGAASYEVVMVLDNSGSMRGGKLFALQDAASDLVRSLFALAGGNTAPDPVRIGLVPFTASVNVGPQYANANWMDTTGIGPTAALNHDEGNADFTNRFDLFTTVRRVNWAGCVEARQHPFDVTDATPTAGIPATLFQPMFAPDEPDEGNGWTNNYLADDGGTCETTPPRAELPCDPNRSERWCERRVCPPNKSDAWCLARGRPRAAVEAGPDYCDPDADNYLLCVQERVCKYDNVNGRDFNQPGEGPNLHCLAHPLTPLSDREQTLLSAIGDMEADGYTNIEQGIVWGWHLLTDNAPFTEGRPVGERGNHKILIVMTDGANTYPTHNNINQSEYMAFNYVQQNYLGVTSRNENVVVDAMNERTLEVCGNIHDTDQITVYTIAFELDDDDAEQILLECASDPAKAFSAEDGAELIAAFRLIAQDIATLRIAE